MNKVDEAVMLAEKNNMTYAELQVKETLGLVKIRDGKLEEVNHECNRGNTQRKQ